MIGLPLADVQADPEIGPDIMSEASFELANMDTFVSNWARNTALDDLEERGGRKLSPEELNNKYKDVEMPFTKPMSEMAAIHLNDEGIKRRQLKEAMASAPGSDFYKGTVNFAQGLLAHAMDPVEFGVGAISGWAFRGAGLLASKAASPTVSAVGSTLSKGGFALDAVEGVAGNAALEPFMLSSAEDAQIEYGIEDSLMNVVAGGLAFPVLKFAGGKSMSIAKNLPNSTTTVAMKNALGQIYAGKKPDVSFAKEAFDDMAYGPAPADVKTGPVRANYEYAPRSAEELKTQPMFIASKQAGTLDGGSKPVGDLRFGDDGLYITDNPSAANNIAAHPLDTDGPAGDVFQARIDQTNLLDLDIAGREVIDELDLADDLRMLLDDADDVNTAYNILAEHVDETGDEAPMKEFMDSLREKGYDGFKYSDDAQGHNSAYIFPEAKEKVIQEGMYRSDPEAIKPMDEAKAAKFREKVMSDENDMHFDPALKHEMETFTPPEPTDIAKAAEETYTDKIKVLEDLERSGVLKDAEDLKAIQKIKEMKQTGDKKVKVLEDFVSCLLAGAD